MAEITNRWTRIQTLFEDALDRPEDERSAWLRVQCGDDPALYREVEALLDGDRVQHPMFAGSAADLLTSTDAALTDLLPSREGERVGAWVLGERIGEGGMGAVYRAERAEADGGFRQTAALKLVKPGMDSAAVLARFRAERQILARLQHPGIARLLDGGLTEAGRPFFAMELVDGEPITDACDARRLSVSARLGLFVTACEAVRYAHRQLVVHRDLKPSNLLVVETPEGLRPVLLDFGIARLLGAESGDDLTRTGQRVLTPAYAAPEQVRGESPTTATDVYALGGLLYRLLCGEAPLDTRDRLPHEVETAILTAPPRRPSDRVTEAGALARGTSASVLARRLRGDLDTICLTALAKEPERRYGSAAELLTDIQRHLDGLPIQARPATRAYRVRKFVERHRAGVLGTAAAVVALVAVTGVYTTRLAAERDRAESEARRSEEVVSFLQDLMLGASPYEAPGEELTARELLDRGAERIGDLGDEPETQAALQVLIGDVYADLGRPEDAIPLYREALATRRDEGLSVDAANTARQLGRALRDTEERDEAEQYLRTALSELEALPGADPVDIALTQRHLGSFLRDGGDYEAAEALYREALATVRRERGPDDPLANDIATSLVVALRAMDRLPEAADLMEEVIASDRRTLAPDDPSIAFSLVMYSTLLGRADRGEEAVEAAREAQRRFEAIHTDPTHPDLASSLQGVAIALHANGQLAEADAMFTDAVDRMAVAYGETDVRVLTALKGHAVLKEERDQPDAAAALFRRAATAAEALPRQQAILLSYLADNRARAADWDASTDALERSIALLEKHGSDDDLTTVVSDWAMAAREGGRPDLADAAPGRYLEAP
ncbi:MAG: serine/threonine-protein kinase [Bacteroidota bacterium]